MYTASPGQYCPFIGSIRFQQIISTLLVRKYHVVLLTITHAQSHHTVCLPIRSPPKRDILIDFAPLTFPSSTERNRETLCDLATYMMQRTQKSTSHQMKPD